MEKRNVNGKNEEPFVPEGLEYRDEHWQKALDGIIQHEKRTDRRRLAWIFSAVALILLVGSYAVATYFATPEKSVNTSQQTESAISAIPESKASDQTMVPQKNEVKIETPSNTTPEKSSIKKEERTKMLMSSNKEDRVVSYENQKPNDRLAIEKSEEEKPSEAPQTIEHKNNIAVVADPLVVAPENAVELHNFIESPEILPASDEVSLYNWDRHFFITPIVKLQLPFATEELQAPNALKSDRNWTEPTWRLWTFVGSSLVTDFSSPLRDIRIDPMAGLRLEYNFNKRIFVDGGLEYFAITNVRRPYSQTSIAYDLNYQRTITTVETHKLHYVSMPLHLGYRIARRHQVSIGFGMSYMITGINEIFQYKQTPTSNTLINHYDDKGFVAGFKDLPVHTELGYSFKLGRNKSIRCAYQFGLTDITKNDYFSSTSFDRNSRLLIDLSIKLKSK